MPLSNKPKRIKIVFDFGNEPRTDIIWCGPGLQGNALMCAAQNDDVRAHRNTALNAIRLPFGILWPKKILMEP